MRCRKRANSVSREGHVSKRRYLGLPTRQRNILSQVRLCLLHLHWKPETLVLWELAVQVLMQFKRDSCALIKRKAPPAEADTADNEILQVRDIAVPQRAQPPPA